MNKNVRHFRSSRNYNRPMLNQRGPVDFNALTRQVWEEIYQRKKIKKDMNALNIIGDHFRDPLYSLGTINSDQSLIKEEYMYFFFLYHRMVEKILCTKDRMNKLESRSFFKYVEVNKASCNFSPIKKPLPTPILKVPPMKLKQVEPSISAQPPMMDKLKSILNPQPKDIIQMEEDLPELPKPPKVNEKAKKLTLKEINDLQMNDHILNALILYGPKIMLKNKEEAMANLRTILCPDVIHMLEEFISMKHQWRNYSFVLYGTDYYQIIFCVKDNPVKFSLKKVLYNCISNN